MRDRHKSAPQPLPIDPPQRKRIGIVLILLAVLAVIAKIVSTVAR